MTSDSPTHFIDPDGDLLPLAPVKSIVLRDKSNLWRKEWQVELRFEGPNPDWTYPRKTLAGAQACRDSLIRLLIKPEQYKIDTPP